MSYNTEIFENKIGNLHGLPGEISKAAPASLLSKCNMHKPYLAQCDNIAQVLFCCAPNLRSADQTEVGIWAQYLHQHYYSILYQ